MKFQVIIQLIMKLLLLLLLLLAAKSQTINADLTLQQYEPMIFQLTFSEPIQRPNFQLMLNNINQVKYTLITQKELSSVYYFTIDDISNINDQPLQSYQLIFNHPLTIGGGRLGVNSFMLQSKKQKIQIQLNIVIGYVIVAFAYFFINLTITGHIAIELLQVYCLLMFRNQMKTEMYHSISQAMLLLNPLLNDGTYQDQNTKFIIISTPMFLIVVSGLIGFVLKRCIWKQKSIMCKIFYNSLVYNLFINIGITFIFTIFFNALQFLRLVDNHSIDPNSKFAKFGYIYSYFNLITTFWFIYLFIYKMNPKKNQTDSSWNQYLKSEEFDAFRKLHQVLILDTWYKRNKNIVIIFKRLLIAAFFFWPDYFQGALLILQFVNIFFIFTVRPYKQQVYMNIVVLCRLLVFIFYVLVVLGNVYFSIGSITVNYFSVKDIIFLIMLLLILMFIFYEIYQNCSNLNYQFRLVRQENMFKLQITEKQKVSTQLSGKRKDSKSFTDSDQMYFRNARYTNFQNIANIRSNSNNHNDRHSHQKMTHSLSGNKDIPNSLKDSGRLKSQTKYYYEMNLMTGRQRNDSITTNQNQKSISRKKDRKKWKKESLLVDILNDK